MTVHVAKIEARGRSGLEAILRSVLSNQFLGWFARSLEHEAASFTRGKNPIGLATKGAMSGVTPTLAVRSCPSFLDSGYDGSPSFLDSYRLPTSGVPLTPPTPTYAMTMLAPTDMQESTLSHNKFVLYLRSLLRTSSALFPCEFAEASHSQMR